MGQAIHKLGEQRVIEELKELHPQHGQEKNSELSSVRGYKIVLLPMTQAQATEKPTLFPKPLVLGPRPYNN